MKPGDTFDRYVILRPVGRGGMGEVYRAQDTRLRRNVALKILSADAGLDTQGRVGNVDRLLREARAAAALEHPNVVVIHDVGEAVPEGATDPVCFLAMEYVQGTVLRELVGKADVPIAQRVKWLADVARALGFAHSRGIVHRDVKPDNVIVREDGVVKVLDFGIARRSQHSLPESTAGELLPTMTGDLSMGTPRYMAPEQMLNESLDGRADQYAWALTAYELLAGESPWSDVVDSVQLVAKILTRTPDPLRVRAPDIPEEITRVIDRALSRERNDRFATMEDLLAALGLPVAPADTTTGRRRNLGAPETSAALAPTQDAKLVAEVPTLAAQHSTPTVGVRPARSWVGAAAALVGLASVAGIVVYETRATHVTAENATNASAAPPPAAQCTSNAACGERLGEAAVCHEGECVRLASEDCRVSAAPGDVGREATVWIGALFPLTGEDATAYGTREFQAVDLARADFAQMLAGANARPQGGRPLALLACDDAVDPHRALRHLVDEVGVPAVIGFRSSNEAIEAATSTLIPKGVMGVAALNTSPMISSLPAGANGERLIWRTTYSAAELALPIAKIVPEVLEPELRSKGGLGKDATMRVALLRQEDAAGLGFADALFRTLRFNGRAALENEGAYHEFVYADASRSGTSQKPSSSGAASANLDEVAAKLVAFAPQVIVDFGGDDPFVGILERVEKSWPESAVRPRYVKAGTFAPSVVQFLGASPERRHRFLGLTSESSTAANARFVARYNETYEDSVTRTFSPNSSYDAFYVVAYAALALGDGSITGSSLSGAVGRLLPPGKAIDVGPSAIFDALNELAAGRNIDLYGATGRLDFDLHTGDAPIDIAVLCAASDDHKVGRNQTPGAPSVRESGLVYDATARALVGELRCP
jgi:ABC-type branched-subunit amino acid transport system substrate-binding protein